MGFPEFSLKVATFREWNLVPCVAGFKGKALRASLHAPMGRSGWPVLGNQIKQLISWEWVGLGTGDEGQSLGRKTKGWRVREHFYLVMKWCCVFGGQGETPVSFGLHVEYLHGLRSCQHGDCVLSLRRPSLASFWASRGWEMSQHSSSHPRPPTLAEEASHKWRSTSSNMPLFTLHTPLLEHRPFPQHSKEITTICSGNQRPSICVPKILIPRLTYIRVRSPKVFWEKERSCVLSY